MIQTVNFILLLIISKSIVAFEYKNSLEYGANENIDVQNTNLDKELFKSLLFDGTDEPFNMKVEDSNYNNDIHSFKSILDMILQDLGSAFNVESIEESNYNDRNLYEIKYPDDGVNFGVLDKEIKQENEFPTFETESNATKPIKFETNNYEIPSVNIFPERKLHDDVQFDIFQMDYDQYDYNYDLENTAIGNIINSFGNINNDRLKTISDPKLNNDLFDNSNFPVDTLIPENINHNEIQTAIVNFDGEIIPNTDLDVPQNINNIDKTENLGIKYIYDIISSYNAPDITVQYFREIPDADGKLKIIYIYERSNMVDFIKADETIADPDRNDDMVVNLDASYISILSGKTRNNIVLMRFLGPVLMILGLLVTLSVLFVAVIKKSHERKKLVDEWKLPGTQYQLIHQV